MWDDPAHRRAIDLTEPIDSGGQTSNGSSSWWSSDSATEVGGPSGYREACRQHEVYIELLQDELAHVELCWAEEHGEESPAAAFYLSPACSSRQSARRARGGAARSATRRGAAGRLPFLPPRTPLPDAHTPTHPPSLCSQPI